MEDIFRYYAIDWTAMIATLLAVWFLGNKNKYGFVSFIISNILWMIIGVLVSSNAILIGNGIFLIMNISGLSKWHRNEKSRLKYRV